MRLQFHTLALDIGGDGAVCFDRYHPAVVELEHEGALAAEPHIGSAIAIQVQFRAKTAR